MEHTKSPVPEIRLFLSSWLKGFESQFDQLGEKLFSFFLFVFLCLHAWWPLAEKWMTGSNLLTKCVSVQSRFHLIFHSLLYCLIMQLCVKTEGGNQGHQKLPVCIHCDIFLTKERIFQFHNATFGLSLYSPRGRSGRLVCLTEEASATKCII